MCITSGIRHRTYGGGTARRSKCAGRFSWLDRIRVCGASSAKASFDIQRLVRCLHGVVLDRCSSRRRINVADEDIRPDARVVRAEIVRGDGESLGSGVDGAVRVAGVTAVRPLDADRAAGRGVGRDRFIHNDRSHSNAAEQIGV